MSGILQLINTFPSGGFAVKNSLRFRSNASAYLSRTFGTPTSSKIFTYSCWYKIGFATANPYLIEGYVSDGERDNISFINNTLRFDFIRAGNTVARIATNQVFRDPSAWYHIEISVDTTQSTDSNRVKMYVNGVQITSFSTATYPSQNLDCYIDSANAVILGRTNYSGGTYAPAYFDGYMAEINFIDGQALTPSSFGAFDATSGVWQPVKYSGTYGTNGFYLKFSDTTSTTTLCYDYSGNGNNWTPNNISLTAGSTYDSMLDSPTNYDNGGTGVGNYAVLNPLSNLYGSTISNGNLTAYCSTIQSGASGTFRLNSGSWYFEETIQATGSPGRNWVGFMDDSYIADNNGFSYTSKTLLYASDGSGGITGGAYGASYTTNDVIGVAFNIDTGTITFYKNGVSQGNLTTGASGTNWRPFVSFGAVGWQGSINFGQRPFAFSVPSGYKALNTQNLP